MSVIKKNHHESSSIYKTLARAITCAFLSSRLRLAVLQRLPVGTSVLMDLAVGQRVAVGHFAVAGQAAVRRLTLLMIVVLLLGSLLLVGRVGLVVELGEEEVEEYGIRKNEDEGPARVLAVVDEELAAVQEG